MGVARCIIRSPILVLLDEASSALVRDAQLNTWCSITAKMRTVLLTLHFWFSTEQDSETEREMQASLREVCRGRTTIAVAHRLSTVMMADELIVLDEGKIVERGTHSELLALSGKYSAMWAAQTDAEYVMEKGHEKANGV